MLHIHDFSLSIEDGHIADFDYFAPDRFEL